MEGVDVVGPVLLNKSDQILSHTGEDGRNHHYREDADDDPEDGEKAPELVASESLQSHPGVFRILCELHRSAVIAIIGSSWEALKAG